MNSSAESYALGLFTRYPHSGSTKTRLIPVLGPDGAAALQKKLTEHTLTIARRLRRIRPEISVYVIYTGTDAAHMREWIGNDITLLRQHGVNLGGRMAEAFRIMCDTHGRAVLIGTDCPAVSVELLSDSYDALATNDIVLGPADDGGYYLIGMNRYHPEVFSDIKWGSSTVFQTTIDRVSDARLTCAYLPVLHDVDRPKDIPWCREYFIQRQMTISIIIPVLNEANVLATALHPLSRVAGVELIVVDGGSCDASVKIAKTCGARVFICTGGRARQQNMGAAHANGDLLLFLHADTRLPDQFDDAVRDVFADESIDACAFSLQIDGPARGLRIIERLANLRSRLLKLPYGDQVLCMRASLFDRLGGFAGLPIMEDFEFARRLRRHTCLAILPLKAVTSSRRWDSLGVVRTTCINIAMVIGYYIGVNPDSLARWYRKQRKKKSSPERTALSQEVSEKL